MTLKKLEALRSVAQHAQDGELAYAIITWRTTVGLSPLAPEALSTPPRGVALWPLSLPPT